MNRESLFRGKRLDNGEWVYGFLVGLLDPTKEENSYKDWIIHNGVNISGGVEVDPATVGQFTGLIDKNGNRIFEGDVLRRDLCFSVVVFTKFDSFECDFYGWGEVCDHSIDNLSNDCVVFSNIHDKPEFLTCNTQP